MTGLVLLIGPQASGKSSFLKERFADTHLRLNLDMLRTRHRERLLFEAVLASKTPCVIDNCNLTAAERARYLLPAKAARFRVGAYLMTGAVDEWLKRNRERGAAAVPDRALFAAAKKLEPPRRGEGLDDLFNVHARSGVFDVEALHDETLASSTQ